MGAGTTTAEPQRRCTAPRSGQLKHTKHAPPKPLGAFPRSARAVVHAAARLRRHGCGGRRAALRCHCAAWLAFSAAGARSRRPVLCAAGGADAERRWAAAARAVPPQRRAAARFRGGPRRRRAPGDRQRPPPRGALVARTGRREREAAAARVHPQRPRCHARDDQPTARAPSMLGLSRAVIRPRWRWHERPALRTRRARQRRGNGGGYARSDGAVRPQGALAACGAVDGLDCGAVLHRQAPRLSGRLS